MDWIRGAWVWIVCHTTVLSVAISAVAACWIAAYTVLLRRSSDALWRSSDRQHATSNRAYVYLDGFNFELTTALDAKPSDRIDLPERYSDDPGLWITRFAIQPRWKNGGNTPTRNMKVRVNWRGPIGPIPPEYVYKEPELFNIIERSEISDRLFIAPKAVEVTPFIEMPGVQALINYGQNPLGIAPMFFIWGRADYKDIFGQRHFIEWCHQIRFDRHDGKTLRASTFQWGEYNRTDED